MNLDLDYAVTVYKKIKVFHEHHAANWIGGDNPSLTWDRIIAVVTDLYNVYIEVNEVEVAAIATQGMLLRYEGTKEKPHIVLIPNNLRPQRKNFVIAKEVCNLMVDEKEDWSPDGCEVIRGMREHLLLERAGNIEATANRFVTSDLFSQIVAIELLYPYPYREVDFEKRIADASSVSFQDIANSYNLPPRMVEVALFPENHDYAGEIWNAIHNENNA